MLSFIENIPIILAAAKPYKKILDVGPGFGKYGLLLREQYLSSKASAGDLVPEDDFYIDCCEITEYFLARRSLGELYNVVMQCSFLMVDSKVLRYYDLVLLIDVVEHYSKDVVIEFLKRCPRALVSTPKQTCMYTQHYYGDPNHHITQWEPSDFEDFQVADHSTQYSYIYMVTS